MLKRKANGQTPGLVALCAVILISIAFCACAQAFAQEVQDEKAERQKVSQLMNQSRFTEALPLLEKLVAANPNEAELTFNLGFVRFATSKTMKGAEARKQARARARAEFVRAKKLGFSHPLLESILESLPEDGGNEDRFSENAQADDAMREAEAAFTQGKLDDAILAYQSALKFDPKLYAAALFIGDSYIKKEQPERSYEWFAKAVEINPDSETAYRYWATGLMDQGKMTEAREKLIEAFITEPYNRLARQGLIQWAQRNNASLAHPKIDIPTSVSSDSNQTTITLDPKMMGNKEDGTAAWIAYGMERALWHNKKFKERYPNEKSYRHSLAEEAAALHLVAQSAREQIKAKQVKQLDPSLDNLIKLDDAGLLEAYILLARADDGIAQDFPAYRKANRDKLRRYVEEYVIK